MQFYRVFVHDYDLIQMLKTNLQKKDRILVNGFLGYKPENDQNGQKKYAGHVEATHIIKVDRFTEGVSENSVEENVQSANE